MADALSDAEFAQFRKLIYDESGITFSDTNRSILDSRIKDLLREKSITTSAEYFKKVSSDKEELKHMLDSVTTNLTRFFRNQAHWDAFEHYVIPHILEEKKKTGSTRLKIWSAGCSTGEEPYTIAMMLKKLLPPGYTFQIIASDLSLKSIMTARMGFYADSKCEGVPPDFLSKYFTRSSGGYQVKREIMDCIRFDYHNLKNAPTERDFDVVFCRNVLIYFDEPAQLVVVNHFWNSMAAHSYLYIGHSESLFGMNTKFNFLKTDWTTLYEKK